MSMIGSGWCAQACIKTTSTAVGFLQLSGRIDAIINAGVCGASTQQKYKRAKAQANGYQVHGDLVLVGTNLYTENLNARGHR